MVRKCGIFLDGGTNIGVAVMAYELNMPLLHRETFRTSGSIGRKMMQADALLQGLINDWRNRRGFALIHIGFEAPFIGQGVKASGARVPVGIACKFEEVADRNGIECSETVSSTMKLIVTGKGSHPKGQAKKAVQSAIFNMGYTFGGEHEADAIGVGRVVIGNWMKGI
jgi:hypothetical protein